MTNLWDFICKVKCKTNVEKKMLKLFLNVTGPVLIEHNKLQNYANNINSISKQKWKEENIFFPISLITVPLSLIQYDFANFLLGKVGGGVVLG